MIINILLSVRQRLGQNFVTNQNRALISFILKLGIDSKKVLGFLVAFFPYQISVVIQNV